MTVIRRRGGAHRRRLRLSGTRTRLFAGFAAVALATAAVITGSSYLLIRNALITRAEDQAASQLADDIAQSGGQLEQVSSGAAEEAIANQMARSGGIVLIISRYGTPTTNQGFGIEQIPAAFREDAQTSTAQAITVVGGSPYVLTGTRIQPGGPEIYLFTSLDSEQAILTELVAIGATSAGLALVAAAVIAFLATRNVLVPIRRLGQAARRLGEGDLDVRMEVEGADEIADVARTFNETAAALARSMDELRAMDAASRRFVADVSHELRTPLTAMTAVTEVLEDVDGADETTASAAHLIANETKRLARLVEDLMEISRFDARTASMRLEPVDVPELVAATLAARGWTGQVEVTMPDHLPAVVDARRLDVVVANLVGNALKHGGEKVELYLREVDGWVVVEVADAGPGVPGEALPHIFDRFYKADKARGRSEGSGLGLSIAAENARLHGGELSARNRSQGGAVFTLRLPSRAEGIGTDQAATVTSRTSASVATGPVNGASAADDGRTEEVNA